MQSMSMLKKEENMVKLTTILLMKHVTTYERCVKASVVLNPPYIQTLKLLP
jgi:hypothetical protein